MYIEDSHTAADAIEWMTICPFTSHQQGKRVIPAMDRLQK
jgi:hypothetical protein